MKRLLSIIFFVLLFESNAFANDFYFVCQQETRTGVILKDKYLYELKNNKLYLGGSEEKLLTKPKISNTSIALKYNMVWQGKIEIVETIFNRKNGNMIEKYYEDEDDDEPAINYFVCDIF
ncbi:hypothetical protein [Candidatus Pelagibacter sp.]|uniref:hypothetical protein n=1 Tax=Candidatus Pelagibacter sp. TaxID=2024849 RepID=UPI003F833731